MAGISDFLESLHVDWQIVLAKKSPQVLQVVKVDLGKAKAAFPPFQSLCLAKLSSFWGQLPSLDFGRQRLPLHLPLSLKNAVITFCLLSPKVSFFCLSLHLFSLSPHFSFCLTPHSAMADDGPVELGSAV